MIKAKKDYEKLLSGVIPQKVTIHRTGVVEFETVWKKGSITRATINGVLDVSNLVNETTVSRMTEILGRDMSKFGGKITLKGIMESNELKSLKIEESKTLFWNKN